jgi:hypothetical protein
MLLVQATVLESSPATRAAAERHRQAVEAAAAGGDPHALPARQNGGRPRKDAGPATGYLSLAATAERARAWPAAVRAVDAQARQLVDEGHSTADAYARIRDADDRAEDERVAAALAAQASDKAKVGRERRAAIIAAWNAGALHVVRALLIDEALAQGHHRLAVALISGHV